MRTSIDRGGVVEFVFLGDCMYGLPDIMPPASLGKLLVGNQSKSK